jgi:exopolyphosphatase/pppGpp-phosphohydrolase
MGIPPAGIGVIKVGSTSVSVLVATTLASPHWEASWDLELLTVPDAVSTLTPVLDEVGSRLLHLGVRRRLVATGEVGRRRPELVRMLRQAGLTPWVMSGEEEAWAVWWAVQAERPDPVVVVDVGGGSTEVVGRFGAASLPFGAAAPPSTVPTVGVSPPADPVIATGGTARALARWFGRAEIAVGDLTALFESPPSADIVRARTGVSEARALLLPGGVRSLAAVLEALKTTRVTVSRRDLRHGLWLAAATGRGEDVDLA